jgi:hypothetical protein
VHCQGEYDYVVVVLCMVGGKKFYKILLEGICDCVMTAVTTSDPKPERDTTHCRRVTTITAMLTRISAAVLALLAFAPAASGFVAPVRGPSSGRAAVMIRRGFLDNILDMVDPSSPKNKKKEDWKEQMYREQQEILRKRRQTGGFLSEEERTEIAQRRQATAAEGKALNELQRRNAAGEDTLEDWKKMRADGTIRTATSGLERDRDSGRLGSEGLFAERIDERLPYIDSGYVPEEDQKKADEAPDVLGDLAKNLFGKKE